MSFHLASSRVRTARCRRRPAPSTRVCHPLRHACQHDRWKVQKCTRDVSWNAELSRVFSRSQLCTSLPPHRPCPGLHRRCTLPPSAEHDDAVAVLYRLSSVNGAWRVKAYVDETSTVARCPHCAPDGPSSAPDDDRSWTCGLCMGEGVLWP